MNRRIVTFTITEQDGNCIHVHPKLTNIYRAQGGEDIILAIAANCIRTIAKTEGLERAIERLSHIVINKTSVL